MENIKSNSEYYKGYEFNDLKKIDDLIDIEEEKYNNELKILPPLELRYSAFELCPYNKIKVVILGQDPYHKVGEAMGLCFSVPTNIKIPPSLRNIFKELKKDTGIDRLNTNLTDWAEQGVLLLNTALTVREHCANSHSKIWKEFTDKLINYISEKKKLDNQKVIFILWGNNAISKRKLIDESFHYVLTAVHPSPLSANRGGFFGCKHFSKCNEILKTEKKEEIQW